ncbi:MAG: N-formylglutamate amidohydrolase [Rhizobacter sp.]|nr:N-formylglutamate amidohydrolase [Rhizobacter sp.]
MPPAFTLHPATATATAAPLLLDSPHSSSHFPPDFDHAVTQADLRQGEDMFIEQLFGDAPRHGAPLLEAGFARTYIDPNRHAGDVDLELLAGAWPDEHRPSGKARIGKALIWRTLLDGRPIYARRLRVAEVQHRIEHYLLPYQQALASLIAQTHARHGVSYHLNCHSMGATASTSGEGEPGTVRADFVLGDRDGTTCASEFTALVRDTLTGLGYEVKINDPYKGVELVRAWSNPAAGRHSLQIEVNKRLYMNDDAPTRSARFDSLKSDLNRLLAVLAQHARQQARERSA